MKGKVLDYNIETKIISGDDGQRYSFENSGVEKQYCSKSKSIC